MKIEHKTDLELTKVLFEDLEIGAVFMHYPEDIEIQDLSTLNTYPIFIKTSTETKFCLFSTNDYNYSSNYSYSFDMEKDEECLELDTTLTINNYL